MNQEIRRGGSDFFGVVSNRQQSGSSINRFRLAWQLHILDLFGLEFDQIEIDRVNEEIMECKELQ
jgi:hypothetical protein